MPTQAQRDALEGPIIDWVHNNPDTECYMKNGRRQLLDHVKNFYLANFSKDLNDQKVNAKVSNLLSYHRGGVIRPERTNKAHIKKSVGAAPGAFSKVEKAKANKKAQQLRLQFGLERVPSSRSVSLSRRREQLMTTDLAPN
jgi:hypothetical protein